MLLSVYDLLLSNIAPTGLNVGGTNVGLYSNLTLRDWLSIHCTEEDVENLFRKALKDNDDAMAVLALAELERRYSQRKLGILLEAAKAGHINPKTHFSTVFANALKQFDSDSIWPKLAEFVDEEGAWPTDLRWVRKNR